MSKEKGFDSTGRKTKVKYYKDHEGKWRWNLRSNGRIIADSGQGYATKWNVKRAAKRALNL